MTAEDIQIRNKKIGANRQATIARHSNMCCKTLKFKIDYKNSNKEQKNYLKMMFVEAKWIYNWLLSQEDIYKVNYKDITSITHKDKNKNDIPVEISYIKSSVKQELITQIVNQIKGLSVLKKKGHTVGKLKYKSEYNSISLKQYNITHYIKGNKVKIQGIKKPLRLLGIKQLNEYNDIEYANAKIIYDGHDYYFLITTFVPYNKPNCNKIKGVDLGIAHTVTASDGFKADCLVEESERIKILQRKLQHKVKGSNNYKKVLRQLRYAYIKLTNKKQDIANKIVHNILSNCCTVVMQDEQISSWKTEYHSERNKKIQHSILGTVKRKLTESKKTVVLNKWYPTTKWCYQCGCIKDDITEKDRIYACSCGVNEDRDIHAAKNMIAMFLNYKDASGTGVTLKPSKKISFNKDFLRKRKMQDL